MLRNSIYGFLGTYGIDRDFILDTMREIIRSYDVPDVRALLRAIQYTVGAIDLDRPTLEFALRMLSQSGDLRKNSGDVFFPM
jgi:hypothetical protein